PRKPRLHGERAAHRTRGVVGLRHRGTEICQQTVAEILVERPSVLEDRFHHALVIVVEERHHLGARELCRESREIAKVAEQDRHLAALSGGALVGALGEQLRYLGREVSAQTLAPPVLGGYVAH